MMDHKALYEVFQEIVVEFSEMAPTNMDEFESKVHSAIHRLGECLIEWKLNDWNKVLREETCQECGSKVENRKRKRQIVTLVADINYERYMSYCPGCGNTEYPLDKALGLRPFQRASSNVEELIALCGASWDYRESEYILKKLLGRHCMSHEAICEKTNEIGKESAKEFEGSKIESLEGDKVAQGDYFEDMELWEGPPERIYIDMDGVMINSRDNPERMEGKVAIVWSERELVKEDTYFLKDKRYMGSFSDTERFYWDITAEVYRRSGGEIDEAESLIRGDGASWIRSFQDRHMPRSRYILDYYHLCERVKECLTSVIDERKRCSEEQRSIMEYLNSDDVEGALDHIKKLKGRYRRKGKHYALERLSGYIERNREGIWYKEAREKGISIGTGSVEKAGDILICRRMKLRGMRWSRAGADAVLNIRILVANGEWDQFWRKYKSA